MRNDNLLVGPEHGADAGVYQLTPDLVIVQSADFFPPHISDARMFGQIAAANAMSDIYAMGARPVTVLNLLATPAREEQSRLLAILDGAREKIAEAGAVIAGGHTITSRTIMFGCSVTGVCHPNEIRRNTTPRPGDALVLTKPIGTGILIHGHATGDTSDAELHNASVTMATLNRLAGESLVACGANASTDVTGFGLIGHALDMVALKQAGIEFDFHAVPLFGRVRELAERGNIPPGSQANAKFTDCHTVYHDCPEIARGIMNDAQTSGGLLISLPPERVDELLARLKAGGYTELCAVVGRVTEEHPGIIEVKCQ